MRTSLNQVKEVRVIPIEDIKKDITNNINKEIIIYEYNSNSKKIVNRFEGTINNVYSNLFSINMKLNNYCTQKCFNYSGFSVGLLQYEIK